MMVGLPFSVRAALAAAVVGSAFLAGWVFNGWRLDADFQEVLRRHADMVAAADKRTAIAQKEQRDEETRRATAQEEVLRVSDIARQRDESYRRDADAAAERLRGATRAAAARAGAACPHPAPAVSGPPTPTPADVLADVLGEADRTAGQLAAAADAARAAGNACQQSYDALRATPIIPPANPQP